jgi:hypothetical protein
MTTTPTNAALPSAGIQLDIFRRMLRIERNDDATRKQIRLGRITAPYYSGAARK